MSIIVEFFKFLKEYKVVALAVAFIIGAAATSLIKSLVDNIIMPVVTVITPSGDWKAMILQVGPVNFGIGPFLGELINFIIIAAVVFLIAKYVMGETKVDKK